MKRINLIPLVAALLLSATGTAQVNVQPVNGVTRVVLEDNARLTVVAGDETRLESNATEQLATVRNGALVMEDNTRATLRLSASGPVRFEVEDNAELLFKGSFRFGNEYLNVKAEDNASVRFLDDQTGDTIFTDELTLSAIDNARIVSQVPFDIVSFYFTAKDHGYVEVASVAKHTWGSDTVNRGAMESVTLDNKGKIVILDRGETGVYTFSPEKSLRSTLSDALGSNKPDRDTELNWQWGFNNWGRSPLSGLGGVTGDAAVAYYFVSAAMSLDYPLINKRHMGLYAGLGFHTNQFHFDNALVKFDPNTGGFVASTNSDVSVNSATLASDGWNSFFNSTAITLPITLSFEPWQYDGFCIRLSAIPGFQAWGYASQQYETKKMDIGVIDKDVRKYMVPFMLDARLTLLYDNFGIYVQTATLPLFKKGIESIYPVSFGISWCMSGR